MHLRKDQEQVLNERGASMLEYAMMAALIAVVCIAGVTSLGHETRQTFEHVAVELGQDIAVPVPPPPPIP